MRLSSTSENPPKPAPKAEPDKAQTPKAPPKPDAKPKPPPKPNPKPAEGKGQPVVQIRPLAPQAGMRRRHRRLVLSFFVLVLMPLAAAIFYLWFVAQDQYASTTGFTVRREEGGSSADLLGNLSQFAGGGGTRDSDVLYEFIQSQGIVQAIDERLDLRSLYSTHWPADPLFALWPDSSIEDLLWYWQRMVRISYDQSTGLIELRVLAFEPEVAQVIGEEIVAESQAMINALNAAARDDLMRYAEADLDNAVARLKAAREAMTLFRTRTQIVDPNADLQGQMGVVNFLQQQLAEALIELDDVSETTTRTDPRVVNLTRRIAAIRTRIAQERESFANQSVAGVEEDYPTLMSEYEGLVVDREYAERAYTAALTSLDVARNNIARQSRYLAAYVQPTLPQTPEYPQRFVLSLLAGLFLVLAWSIMALVYYSLRDRR